MRSVQAFWNLEHSGTFISSMVMDMSSLKSLAPLPLSSRCEAPRGGRPGPEKLAGRGTAIGVVPAMKGPVSVNSSPTCIAHYSCRVGFYLYIQLQYAIDYVAPSDLYYDDVRFTVHMCEQIVLDVLIYNRQQTSDCIRPLDPVVCK